MIFLPKIHFIVVFILPIIALVFLYNKLHAHEAPMHYIPSHISSEAQEFLKATTPFAIKPNSLEEWEKSQAEFNKGNRERSDKAREDLIAESKTVEIAGVPVTIATPKNYNSADDDKIIVFIHGGAYVVGAPKDYHMVFAPIAHAAKLKTFAIDYGLAPQHPYPEGLNDCIAVYKEILKKYKPENIVFVGDSAGGGMTLATLLKARDMGLPLPKAVTLLSPWADITKTGDTYFTLEGISPNLHFDKNLQYPANVYSGTHDKADPFISPINADYSKGFPPSLITTGTRDLFLSNCVRLYRKMKESGVPVTIDIWEGMWHVFQDNGTPEGRQSAKEIGDFLREHIDTQT